MKNIRLLLLMLFACVSLAVYAQEPDDFDDFDPSMFEEAGSTLKAYCTNKVLGQSPASLISFGFDFQGPATLSPQANGFFLPEDAEFNYGMGFRFVSNVPVLSRNNILINWGLSYVHFGLNAADRTSLSHPLNVNLANRDLKWLNTNFTIFKPLNEKRFLLAQIGFELNGDYAFNNLPELGNTRVPAALIYGFKPHDRLMWGVGFSRTYLGGSLNYLPIIYYFHTFKGDKWGIESTFPARIQARYRMDSRNLLLMGYQVEGATYRLSRFDGSIDATIVNPYNDIELRKSEIRLGLTYARGLKDFIWVSGQAGYRINYSYELDRGEFYRGFDDTGFFLQNGLTNTPYVQFTISLVSP